MQVDSFLWLVPTLPFVGFLVNGVFGDRFARPTVGLLAVLGPLGAFIISVLALMQAHHHPAHQVVWQWMAAGNLAVDVGLQADPLTCVMLMNVTGIGAAIHVFSYGYMHEDPSFARFMAYLNLFLSAMIVLVMADNLLLLFVGWEGVGLCSYLLIGFWYEDFANVDAGRKAFIVNRIGDFAFLIGTFLLFSLTGELGWEGLEAGITGLDTAAVLQHGPMAGFTVKSALTVAALCLFGGATGKSAQIPLYIWLPDAMAGPTPVSALIHAATMVTAGVYLIGRLDFLYVDLPTVGLAVALVASTTAVLSGFIAIAQNDIKKILAYSTVSQLGFMFAGMATTFWQTGMFHVLSHAFFKALLFLGAGTVIHALHGEQDIRKMGGLYKDLRPTAVLFLIGAIALAGVPPFTGFFSKDEILAAVHMQAGHAGGLWTLVFAMLVLASLLTAFYTTRMVVITFFGKPHDAHRHLHQPHWTMISVLGVLAFLSVIGGLLHHPFEHFLHDGWSEPEWRHHLAEGAGTASVWVARLVSVAVAGAGIALGGVLYGMRPDVAEAFVNGAGKLVHKLVLEKFYVDEMVDWVIVRPLRAFAGLLYTWVDRLLIDGLAVEGPGKLVVQASAVLRQTQLGAVSVATTAMLVGSVLVLLWMVLNG